MRNQRHLPITLVAFGIMSVWLQPTVVAQQETGGRPPTVVEELTRLNHSVARLAEMMAEFLAGQEADLLMKRLEILQRRLLPDQEELQREQKRYDSTIEELEMLQVRYEMIEKGMDEEEREGEGLSQSEREMFEFQHVAQVRRLKAKGDLLWQQLEVLENRVAGNRENIADLEDLLDEKLGLR